MKSKWYVYLVSIQDSTFANTSDSNYLTLKYYY